MKINIGNKSFDVKEAKTDAERRKGLQNIESLPEDEGMIFYYDYPQEVCMWMKDTYIPLDIIFLNEDQEVIAVRKGTPESEKRIIIPNTMYVLEVNKGSGIKKGDVLEFEDNEEDEPVMKVLFPDGSEQMALYGGERIFSRKNTKVLIRKAKKAQETQSESDFKALGKYMFKCLKIQDNREPEYVQTPS